MTYSACIEAAGVPVLAYWEEGDYQGKWIARTAQGFYWGYFGSCSFCDQRQGAHGDVPWDDDDKTREEKIRAADAAIGRKILDAPPLSGEAMLAAIAADGLWDDDASDFVRTQMAAKP